MGATERRAITNEELNGELKRDFGFFGMAPPVGFLEGEGGTSD
jgi:hypothetical protein